MPRSCGHIFVLRAAGSRGCLRQLQTGLRRRRWRFRAVHLAEFFLAVLTGLRQSQVIML